MEAGPLDVPARKEVTQLLREISHGDDAALRDVMPLIYEELYQLAHRHLQGERAGHTLNTTALVHEAYLKLVSYEHRGTQWQSRSYFFAVASGAMRRVLVDHARRRNRAKRGGDWKRVPLRESLLVVDDQPAQLLALDEALDRLAQIDERQARIVECRFFGGLNIDEIAEVLAISPATVKRNWSMARAWLFREISGG